MNGKSGCWGRLNGGKQILKVVRIKILLVASTELFFTISSNSSDKSRDSYVLCNLQSISIR